MTCNVKKGKLGGLSGCMGSSAKGYVHREARAGAALRKNTAQQVRKTGKC